MRVHAAATLLAVLVATACGSSDPGETIEPPLEPAPPEGGQQLATTTYRLAPGEEVYRCYQFYSPEDAKVGITRVDAITMEGVHHLGLFQAFGRNEDDAPHDCNTLLKTTWLPIWGIGASPETLEMPAGVGFVIRPYTQYIMQLHLVNSTDSPIEIRAGVNLTYERDTARLQPAGMYAFGTFRMEIPPNVTDFEVPIRDCQPDKEMDVFAVFPHMHKRGTKLTVTRTGADGQAEEFYRIDPWLFGDQPIERRREHVAADDTFTLTCHYDNPTAQPIHHGESTDDEMCFFVLFYYPFDELDGCVLGA